MSLLKIRGDSAFSYDSGGRRIAKTVTANGVTDSTQYIYEGAQAIGEVRKGLLDSTLIAGAGLDDVVARILSATSSGSAQPQVRTMITDALGSVIAQAKADQSVEIGYGYSPFGETLKIGPEQGTAPNTLQYTGRENDGTGLYYYRARYYDPMLKQLPSEDPIGIAGGLNTKAIVGGNPISRTDPTGQYWQLVRTVLQICGKEIVQWVRQWIAEEDTASGNSGLKSSEAAAPSRPEGVPENWTTIPSRDGKGTKWVDPSNPKGGNYVRERADGTLTQIRIGRALDVNGNPAPGMSSPEAHFPRSQWTFRP